MTPPSAAAAAVDEYARVASWAVTETGNVLRGTIDAVESGTYGVDAYVNAVGRLTLVAVNGWYGWLNATMVAAALSSGAQQPIDQSTTVVVAVPADGDERDVFVHTPFSRGGGSMPIPAARITLSPTPLPAGGDAVQVVVDTRDLSGGVYLGALGLGPANAATVVPAVLTL